MAIRLKVTPGITFTASTRVGDGELNRAATPLVELIPDGTMGIAYLNMAELAGALADTLRGRNFLGRCNFWPEDWVTPVGLECPDGVWTENAYEWEIRPTGGTVNSARIQSAPDTNDSVFALEVTGGAGVSETALRTWVPAGIAGSLRGEELTFSVYVNNLTGATAYVTVAMLAALDLDRPETVEAQVESAAIALNYGEWTRIDFTWDMTAYEAARNGMMIEIRTAALTSGVKSLQYARAQLETGETATPFIRPLRPILPREAEGVRWFEDGDKSQGAFLRMQLGTGEQVALRPPPTFLITPTLRWNAAGYPEWQGAGQDTISLSYTGDVYKFKAPAGAITIRVYEWGAGASNDGGTTGGVGGHTWGEFQTSEGEEFLAIVGQGGFLLVNPFGFAGSRSPSSTERKNGGGGTFLFRGHGAVTAASADRLLAAAGGGGTSQINATGGSGPAGGNGNDPDSSGGESTFKGGDATGNNASGLSAGGGGYHGGTAQATWGKGGSGFLHADKVAGEVLHTARSTPVNKNTRLVVPGSTSPYYTGNAGQTDCNGLMVVVWNAGLNAPGAPKNTVAPEVTGDAEAGSALACSPGTWDPPFTSEKYQWFVGGAAVADTDDAYVTQPGDVGKAVTCRVSGFNAQGFGVVMSSNSITVVAP